MVLFSPTLSLTAVLLKEKMIYETISILKYIQQVNLVNFPFRLTFPCRLERAIPNGLFRLLVKSNKSIIAHLIINVSLKYTLH